MDTVTLLTGCIIFLFGITVGSFLNVCIFRIPKKESIVTVPSHCVSCGKRLRPYELIPLFSYLFLRGRCSACKSRISPQYPLVEAANGVLWVIVFARFGAAVMFPAACLSCSALLVLSMIDARTTEIPNGCVLVILAMGLLNLVFNLGSWRLYVIGFFAVSLPLYLIWMISGGAAIGGGDVKLMAACGLLLGWKNILLALFIGCVLGSVIHLSLMAAKKVGRRLAMGPYLSAGVFLALLFGDALLGWYLSLF